MKYTYIIILSFALLAGKCSSKKVSSDQPSETSTTQNADTITTSTGLKIVYKSNNATPKPAIGDKVTVHYRGKLADGTLFDESYARNSPFAFVLGKGQVIKGWDEGIAMLGKGDSATLIIPYQLGYGENGFPPTIPQKADLYFDVHLLDFKSGHKPYDTAGKASFITASGLKVFIIEPGDTSLKPTIGRTITAHYAGYLLDGTTFGNSFDNGEPIAVQVGMGRVIPGWEEVLMLMGKGTKYKVVIPSNLGYGNRAMGPIPPNSTLIFDLHLIDIVN